MNVNKSIRKAVQLIVTVLIFYIIFRKFDINLLDTLKKVNPWYLLLACVLRLVVSPILYINRWKLFLKHSGVEEKFFSLLKISMISAFFGMALPSSQGADVVRMVMIEKRHKGLKIQNTTSSTVLIERIIGFVILALMGLIFTIITDFPDKYTVLLIIVAINILLWLAVFFITNRKCYEYVTRILSKFGRFKGLVDFISRTYYSFLTFPYKKVLLSSIVIILLFQLNTVLIVFCVFKAFSVDVPFIQHLAFYPIIGILSTIPIAISGLGLREGFFVYFYSLLGVSAATAVSVSLVNYVIETALVGVLGGILYLIDSIKIKKTVE